MAGPCICSYRNCAAGGPRAELAVFGDAVDRSDFACSGHARRYIRTEQPADPLDAAGADTAGAECGQYDRLDSACTGRAGGARAQRALRQGRSCQLAAA